LYFHFAALYKRRYSQTKIHKQIKTASSAKRNTDSMEESHPSEANSHPYSQIPSLLWNPEVHYSVHRSPPLVSILCWMLSLINSTNEMKFWILEDMYIKDVAT
jgi:hypothetical protein